MSYAGAVATYRKNAILTGIMARLLDGPGALRKYLMERFIMDGYTLSKLLEDTDAAEEFVRATTVGVWHASCSTTRHCSCSTNRRVVSILAAGSRSVSC